MKTASSIALVIAAASLASCSATPNLLPINDLDRPTDVAFMCFGAYPDAPASTDAGRSDAATGTDASNTEAGSGADGSTSSGLRVSGRPMRVCHPPGVYDPVPSTTARTFAFLPNSASGELSVVDADHWKLVDLIASTEGYGQIPLGQNPAQISVSSDGCRLLSANRGSCDLTLVDPSVLVAPVLHDQNDNLVELPAPRTAAETIRPVRGDGSELVAAPYEAMFLPQETAGLDGDQHLCQARGARTAPVRWPATSGPIPWRAIVTYPSCDLIVLIELPSGKIVDSVKVEQSADQKSVTLVDQGTSPVCGSASCPGQSLIPGQAAANVGSMATADGSAPDAAAAAPDAAGGAPDAGDAGTVTDAAPSAAADAGAGAADAKPTPAPVTPAIPGIQFTDTPYFGADPTKPGPFLPGSIAILPNGERAYVGLAGASFVVAVDIKSPGTLSVPSTGAGIYLHEGARGASRVRLSVDPYKYTRGLTAGVWDGMTSPLYSGVFVGAEDNTANTDEGVPSPDREYLYAIARDDTLRVVQVLNSPESECETNIDPLNLPAGVDPTTACVPVDPTHRRPFSVGPGLRFPTIPIDVAAADILAPPTGVAPGGVTTEDHSEETVEGAHAWVLTSSGVVYLANIEPVLRKFTAVVPSGPQPGAPYVATTMPTVQEQWPFVNTLRDRNEISYSVELDPSSGPPRVDVLAELPATGPYVEPFWAQGSDNNATALATNFVQTDAFFPREPPLPAAKPMNYQDPIDRRAVTPQTWTITWEGALTSTRYQGHVIGEGQGITLPGDSNPGPHDALFEDGGTNFCSVGVVQGDLLTLAGCTTNSQCGVGEVCLMNTALTSAAGGLPVTGLCVDPNLSGQQFDTCAPFLDSIRRYEIVSAFPTQLVLRPHPDELALSSLTPCRPAVAASGTTKAIPDSCPDLSDDPTTGGFKCQPLYGDDPTVLRCLMSGCTVDHDCRLGMSCVDFKSICTTDPKTNQKTCKTSSSTASCEAGNNHCFCAEAPPLDSTSVTECFDQLTAYQVAIGNGFLVTGSQTGVVTLAPQQASGACALNPTPDPRFTFRLPIKAPHCVDGSGKPINDNGIDSRVDPDFVTTMGATAGDDPQSRWIGYASSLLGIAESTPTPDPCLYFGGPAVSDTTTDPTTTPTTPGPNPTPGGPPAGTHVRALFRNGQLGFVLANLDRGPLGQFQTSFDVHGGFNPQIVQSPSTISISTPARIVLGPVDSATQKTAFTLWSAEVPYLFVVDQRRAGAGQAGGATRGQLLRIHPLGFAATLGNATGNQPIFQDYTASGQLFPIQ